MAEGRKKQLSYYNQSVGYKHCSTAANEADNVTNKDANFLHLFNQQHLSVLIFFYVEEFCRFISL